VALFVLLVTSAVACTGGGGGSADDTTTTTIRVLPRRTTGFDGVTIRLGVVVDLSGPGREEGRAQAETIEAYWSAVNAGGGVDGRYQVELLTADTAGTPEGIEAAYLQIRDEVVLTAFVGPAAVAPLAPLMADDVMTYGTDLVTTTVAADPHAITVAMPIDAQAGATFGWRVTEASPAATWCRVGGTGQAELDSTAGAVAAAAAAGVTFTAEVDRAEVPAADQIVAALTDAGCREVWLGLDPPGVTEVLAATPATADLAFTTIGPVAATARPADAVYRVLTGIGGAEWDPVANPVMGEAQAVADRYLAGRPVDDAFRRVYATQMGVQAVLDAAVDGDDLERAAVLARVPEVEPVDTGGLVAAPSGPIRVFRLDQAEGGETGLVLVEEISTQPPTTTTTTAPS
jgi:ABC-type branched-subunit amino acid transport system substrate-binding protein